MLGLIGSAKKSVEKIILVKIKKETNKDLKRGRRKNDSKKLNNFRNLVDGKRKKEDDGLETRKENEPKKRTEDGEVRMKGKNDQDQLEGSKDKQPQEKKVNKQEQHTDSGR